MLEQEIFFTLICRACEKTK